MPDWSPDMELLRCLGDVGIADPLPVSIQRHVDVAVCQEITRASNRTRVRGPSLGTVLRVLPVPAILAVAVAVAAAAASVVIVINPFQVARRNAHDSPLRLFQRNPDVIGATPAAEWRQTVIPSTVLKLGTFNLTGVGTIAYWTAQTKQHGICGALGLPDATWVGTQNGGQDGGSLPGCYPSRRQVGAGALTIDGFDFISGAVFGDQGQRWDLIYGKVTAGKAAARVIDTHSGRSASLLRDDYFAIAVHPVGNDWGDSVHLKATDTDGRTIAIQGKPLAGTPTTKCIGRYNVRRERIPGTDRFSLIWSCRKYERVLAK
jgi:hypothetical protein